MGAEEEMPSIEKPRQRVKVYRLNDEGKWDDWGTGHVTVDYLERSEDLGLFVIDEEDNETLLAHHIRSDEIYRRQDDTIISWRDPEYSTELALSFQETAGCSCIWEQICGVKRNLHLDTHDIDTSPCLATEVPEASVSSQGNGETFKNAKSELREFPAVSLSTLPSILKTVVECGIADQMRVIELILHNQDFFQKLIELFRTFEDSQEVHGLRLISKLVKGIILLNSPLIFEKIFGDELIMDIIGSFEYDPEVPHVQHHRAFLKEHVVFKEAIPISDPLVLSKIQQTYRVGYIKDVILPRELDEATVANLNSIIDANNDIVFSLLKDDNTFIQELFARMRSSTTSPDSKRNLVLFLHEFCSLSKSLQLGQQLRFFRDLMNEGMFDIITDALRSQDKRLVLTGTDILNLFMSKDPNFLRSYVIRLEGDPLFGLLVQGMTTDFGEDMHYQFLEILRSLLDSHTLSGPQRDTIIEIFYEKRLDQLIDVITSSCPSKGSDRSIGKSAVSGGGNKNLAATKPEILSNICELLCFCVYHHPCRIKCNLLLNNVIEKVLFLTRRREKYLVVAAIRFVRGIISHSDEQVLRYIVKNDLLKPVVESFVCNGNRYNLLNSAVLELFEYIRKQNLKILVKYLVDSFWNQLVGFDYLPSIQTLKLKYEQYQENYETNTIELVSHRKRVDDRALEKEEEEYFNEDSDEEDTASACTSDTHHQQTQLVLPNGEASSRVSFCSGSGGLVDYDDDDEDYNPPHRSEPHTSNQEERTENCLESRRQLTSREEFPLLKKPRLDKKFKDCVFAVVCSASNRASSVDKKTITRTHAATHTLDEVTVHETHGEKEPASPTKCSNCLTDRSDTRELNSEEHSLTPPAGNSSPSEIAINGSNIAGSEPYSVR